MMLFCCYVKLPGGIHQMHAIKRHWGHWPLSNIMYCRYPYGGEGTPVGGLGLRQGRVRESPRAAGLDDWDRLEILRSQLDLNGSEPGDWRVTSWQTQPGPALLPGCHRIQVLFAHRMSRFFLDIRGGCEGLRAKLEG